MDQKFPDDASDNLETAYSLSFFWLISAIMCSHDTDVGALKVGSNCGCCMCILAKKFRCVKTQNIVPHYWLESMLLFQFPREATQKRQRISHFKLALWKL